MSTEQPGDDPFRKKDRPGGYRAPDDEQEQAPGGDRGGARGGEPPRYGGPWERQGPYGTPPPPEGQGGESPYGGGPYGGPHGGPYGGGPYASNPYGDVNGAVDPLAGMPPLASRGKRLLARIIDALLIAIPIGLIMGFAQGGWGTADDGRAYGQQAVYSLVYLVYEGLMLTNSGQTVGKKLMRIRVAVLVDGRVPRGAAGWLRALVYHVPPLVPCVGFVFWLANVLFCTWDKPYRQCLHDKAAKTVVVATD